MKPSEQEEFNAFFIVERYELAVKGTLIPHYDPENEKGDVYAYICNERMLRQAYGRFKKEHTIFKGMNRECDYDEAGNLREDLYESRQRVLSQEDQNDIQSLCSRLFEKPLDLQLPESGKFDRVQEHAGLQLYPRLDNTIVRMWQLMEHVHDAVRKADSTRTYPAHTIEYEHQKSAERITEWEYALLEKLYESVELPVIYARWHEGEVWTQPRGKWDVPVCKSSGVHEFPATTHPSRRGKWDVPVHKSSLPVVLACNDGTPPPAITEHIASSTKYIRTSLGTFRVKRFLDDDWALQITVEDLSGQPVPIRRIRISWLPADRDMEKATRWSIDMKWMPPDKRLYLLDEPLIVQLSNGVTVQCIS